MGTQPILLIANLSNGEKQAILKKHMPYSNLYHLFIGKEHEAEVIRTQRGWSVRPREGSWLNEDDCDAIQKAVENQENPNF